MTFTPRDYQIVGKHFLRSRNFAMLGDAPGVGKTGQAIIAAESDWRILIVCPASVKIQWQKALLEWRNWPALIISSSKDRIPEQALRFIINYDLLYKEKLLNQLLKMRFDLIIYDESHKLKSLTAKRTKVALNSKYLRPRAKRIWFLTGTPIKNRPIDLFPILKSCAPEVIKPYDSYLKFSYRFCGAYQGSFGLDNSGATHLEDLSKRLKNFMLRREKRDVLVELPPRIISKVELPCTPTTQKIIEEEEKRTIELAGENDPSLFKLGEIVRIRKALAKFKVPVAVDYIKDLLEAEEKVVVFFYHKEVLNDLRRAFKDFGYVFIDGSVAPTKRSGIVEKFRTRKEVRLFFGQMEASGEAIDGLQTASSCCVFVEPSWSHTDIEQCIGRLERAGQRNDVNVHILTIKDTLESRMMDVVAMKLNTDKKLYNQKENVMAPKLTPEERTVVAIELIGKSLERIADVVEMVHHQQEAEEAGQATEGKPSAAAPVIVPAEDDEEITDDAIRARAGDVCALLKDGSGKTKCVEIIKKVGGGKISNLKTQALKKKCMKELDALYNELSEGAGDL